MDHSIFASGALLAATTVATTFSIRCYHHEQVGSIGSGGSLVIPLLAIVAQLTLCLVNLSRCHLHSLSRGYVIYKPSPVEGTALKVHSVPE